MRFVLTQTRKSSCAASRHCQLNPAELAKAGLSEDKVRLLIGIEHIDDLQADLEQALAAA